MHALTVATPDDGMRDIPRPFAEHDRGRVGVGGGANNGHRVSPADPGKIRAEISAIGLGCQSPTGRFGG